MILGCLFENPNDSQVYDFQVQSHREVLLLPAGQLGKWFHNSDMILKLEQSRLVNDVPVKGPKIHSH